MKKIFIILFSLLAPLANAQNLPPWQEGWFDIHHIATGKGECQFLVFPDGTTMVIDCGDTRGLGRGWLKSPPLPDSTRTPAQWAARYMDRFSPKPGELDYVLLSHFHSDHMGESRAPGERRNGYLLAGLSELAEYERFGVLVDRGYPDYDYPSVERVEKMDPMMRDYKRFVAFKTGHGEFTAQQFELGSRKQFRTLSGRWDFEVWNVAGGLRVVTKGRKTKVQYREGEPLDKLDENMFSCAQLFRYGPFKYYSGGDLPGGKLAALPFERDYESAVAELIGHCQVIKADHHGYRDSMNPYFLWKTAPEAIIVSASEASHPRRETVERVTDPLGRGRRELYTTSEAAREKMGEEAWSKIKGTGHIVVRVYEGGASWQLFVLDATSPDYPIKMASAIYQTEE